MASTNICILEKAKPTGFFTTNTFTNSEINTLPSQGGEVREPS
jgi:hypothetical protein